MQAAADICIYVYICIERERARERAADDEGGMLSLVALSAVFSPRSFHVWEIRYCVDSKVGTAWVQRDTVPKFLQVQAAADLCCRA